MLELAFALALALTDMDPFRLAACFSGVPLALEQPNAPLSILLTCLLVRLTGLMSLLVRAGNFRPRVVNLHRFARCRSQ